MNEITTQNAPVSLPRPKVQISIRPGTLEDVPFIDAMQKKTHGQVGFMPTMQLEGKIKLGHVLVAEENERVRGCTGEGVKECAPSLTPAPVHPSTPAPIRLGYVIGNDRYFKRDEVGVIYALNVVPGAQRKLVGATLIKALFERSAYGCKLFSCWCAQDIAANYFWESIGFVPIAFRTGSKEKGPDGGPRVHIFWQKRIREGDCQTPYWYPHETTGGAIREDRLVLPIPPGTHWKEAKPIVLPGAGDDVPRASRPCLAEYERITGETPVVQRKKKAKPVEVIKPKTTTITSGGWFRTAPVKVEAPKEKRKREPKPKQKNDPRFVAAARELRGRWMEEVQSGRLVIESQGKYEVARLPVGTGGEQLVPALPAA